MSHLCIQTLSVFWDRRQTPFNKKQTLAEYESYQSVSKPPPTPPPPRHRIHRVGELKRMQATLDNAVVWLSVAPHTVSGAHFHTICMIRLIGLVWKHFRGTMAEFLQPRQLEMRIEKNDGTSQAQTRFQPVCVKDGWIEISGFSLINSSLAWIAWNNMKITVKLGFFDTFTLSVSSVHYSYHSVDMLGSLDPWKHPWLHGEDYWSVLKMISSFIMIWNHTNILISLNTCWGEGM